MNVLLVEDDAAVREGMTDVLEEVATVETATTVDAALTRLKSGGLGLVVADLNIGSDQRDGIQVVAEAKKQSLPVIVCTGFAGADVREALGAIEPDAVVFKPFQVDEVVALATRLLLK